MATGTLTGSTIAATYKSLLKVKGGANTILDGDIQIIEDGDGVDSVLGLATDSALISGDGNKLYFYDADGDEHISADASGVLSIAAGAEIDLTATAIDINGTVDLSSTLVVNSNTTITTADNSVNLSLISTDADENEGPKLLLYRNSGSPADGDVLGQIQFHGEDSNAQQEDLVILESVFEDVTNGSEDGTFRIKTKINGTNRNRLEFTSTEAVFNQDSQDIDFRVESDNSTNALFVQGSDGNVGIGTSSPDVRLGQKLDMATTDDYGGISLSTWSAVVGDAAILDFKKSSNAAIGTHGAVVADESLGFLVWRGSDANSGKFVDAATIKAEVDGTPGNDDMPGRLIFSTTANGAASTTERMRIDSAGNVGIGTAAPAATIPIGGFFDSDGTALEIRSGGTGIDAGLFLRRSDDYLGLDIYFNADSTYHTYFDNRYELADFVFRTGTRDDSVDKEVMRIEGDTGNVGIGTTAPQTALHIAKNVSGEAVALTLDNPNDDSSQGHVSIQFRGMTSSSGVIADAGKIQAYSTNDDWAGGELRFSTKGTNDALVIGDAGNVGIGDSSPDAHLKVEDTTIDTTATYTGFKNIHTKTAGATDASDYLIGLESAVTFNDGAAYFAELMGGYFETHSLASAGESSTVYGIYNRASMSGSTDVNNIYGSKTIADVNAGTVDTSVYGQYTDIDVESGCSLGDHVWGHFMTMDVDQNPTGNVFGLDIQIGGAGVDATADWFFRCYDQENSDTVAQITALAGVATFDSGDFAGAPDYAEYFESKSGSAIAIGKTVKLDGDKIVACSEGDTPIGVVRPKWSSSVVCGAAPLRWAGKYMKDDYDEVQMEDYTQIKWTEEVDFDEYIKRGKSEEEQRQYSKVEGSKAIEAIEAVEAQDAVYETVVVQEAVEEVLWSEEDELPEGVEAGDVKTEAQEEETEEQLVSEAVQAVEGVEGVDEVPDTYFREHCYHSDRIPEGITAPDDAEVLTPSHQRKKLNPDYDESQDYVKRADRDEWCLIGLLGQIPITKGQPTGNWIKMKDVSDTVEMYFVK